MKEAYQIAVDKYGFNHADTSGGAHELGEFYLEGKAYSEAAKAFEIAWAIQRK